jgi:hypothetical protein
MARWVLLLPRGVVAYLLSCSARADFQLKSLWLIFCPSKVHGEGRGSDKRAQIKKGFYDSPTWRIFGV